MKVSSRSGSAFTLVEVIVVMAIIAVVASVFIVTLAGLKKTDQIDRTSQQIYDDLIYIRSRAVSTNLNHRLNFYSTTAWALEAYNGSTWSNIATNRQMTTNVWLANNTQTTASTNVEATPRGLFTLNNGITGQPYVTVGGMGTSKLKSIWVHVGGAIEFRTP